MRFCLFQSHLGDICPFTLIACQYDGCSCKITRLNYDIHSMTCSWKIEKCNLCGDTYIKCKKEVC